MVQRLVSARLSVTRRLGRVDRAAVNIEGGMDCLEDDGDDITLLIDNMVVERGDTAANCHPAPVVLVLHRNCQVQKVRDRRRRWRVYKGCAHVP